MTTFTNKELIKEIKERISSLEVRDDIERRAYEIALVSLEVEPDEREAYELFMEKRFGDWICPYISRHLLSLNPLQARCRRYSRGER